MFMPWLPEHQTTFNKIKTLIISCDCLINIDHNNMGNNQIFITCNTSNCRTGTVLSLVRLGKQLTPLLSTWLPWKVHKQATLCTKKSCSQLFVLLPSGTQTYLVPQSLSAQITELSRILTHRKTSHGAKLAGRSFWHTTTTPLSTSKTKIIPLWMHSRVYQTQWTVLKWPLQQHYSPLIQTLSCWKASLPVTTQIPSVSNFWTPLIQSPALLNVTAYYISETVSWFPVWEHCVRTFFDLCTTV